MEELQDQSYKKFGREVQRQLLRFAKNPPLTYAEYIDQKVWDEFVAKILTPEWEALQKV